MSDEGHHEILIIKRGGGGHHDEHHGGVWKIAFADFMTAMMAFFLVMWLISANDKTKATIAKYFNPIELVDSTPQPVGLNDTKKDDPNIERKNPTSGQDSQGKDAAPSEKVTPAPAAAANQAVPKSNDTSPLDDATQSAKHDEVELMRDPYAVLEEIAKTSVTPPKQGAVTEGSHPAGGSGAVGLKNGEAFRDPFEPQPIAAGGPLGTVPDAPSAAPPAGPPPAPAASPAAPSPASPAFGDAKPAPQGTAAAAATPAPAAAAASAAEAADKGDDKPLGPAALRTRIAALAKAADSGPGAGAGAPKVEVRHTEEGTLISLTDSAEFSMFASASARPSPKTVLLMASIGRLLKAQKGDVTIRGYTDSRPFRSETYDNWRLSSERAHIAQFMLLRGGLEVARIDRIEGYADHHPKLPKDPEAAENRRIEILLRNPTP